VNSDRYQVVLMAGGPKYTSFGVSLADLRLAAQDRLADADALYAAARYASAIGMGIYALEIYLKTRICDRLRVNALPIPFQIHELDGLLLLSGLSSAKDAANPRVRYNWDSVADLAVKVNDLRYLPGQNWTQQQVQDFLQQLRDPPDGVLPWLSGQP
jgi:hypothetical protein